MAIVFTKQTFLRIRVTTGIDISTAQTKVIKYQKPDGSVGTLTAQTEDSSAGIIYADLAADKDILDIPGNWLFWASISFSDGRNARGQSFEVKVLSDP